MRKFKDDSPSDEEENDEENNQNDDLSSDIDDENDKTLCFDSTAKSPADLSRSLFVLILQWYNFHTNYLNRKK